MQPAAAFDDVNLFEKTRLSQISRNSHADANLHVVHRGTVHRWRRVQEAGFAQRGKLVQLAALASRVALKSPLSPSPNKKVEKKRKTKKKTHLERQRNLDVARLVDVDETELADVPAESRQRPQP